MKIDLYRLLPSVYRNRDVQLGEPLRALLGVLGNEIDTLRQDIDQLYDNWFVETCDEWVVPYIGDLLGVEGLHPGRPEVFSLRAFVANTLAYRRRKGTSSVLENIAQDVSGWSVSGVEFFQLLTTTQHQDHVRMTTVWSTEPSDYDRIGAVGTIDVRQIPLLARLGTAFDTASRTIDIRPFTQYDGWHNVDRLGIFLWRLRSYPMREMPLLHLGDVIEPESGRAFQTFYLHPLAVNFPLFASPVRQIGATQRRREWEVPQPIDRDAFNADIARYYGDEKSLLVVIDGEPVSADCVVAAALDWSHQGLKSLPTPSTSRGDHHVFIDVEHGRLVLEPKRYPETGFVDPASVRVTYHCGFSTNIGGGTYGREITDAADAQHVIRVSKCSDIDTLTKALAQRQGPCTVIRIVDSGIYEEPRIDVAFEDGEEIIIEAADGMRPCIKGYLGFIAEELEELEEPHPDEPDSEIPDPLPSCLETAPPISRLRLSGLLIKGYVLVEGRIQAEIEHCTLVADPDGLSPSHSTLHVVSLNYFLELDIRHSIVGSLRINEGIKQLRIRDSIVDATLGIAADQVANDDIPTLAIYGRIKTLPDSEIIFPGPEVIIERSTIFGSVHVRAMPLASESIFTGLVNVIRKQDGCMRYCYVDASVNGVEDLELLSRTPRRFRCQPDLTLTAPGTSGDETDTRARIRKQLTPVFCSRTYGHPSYARLASRCPEEIRKGAENGSEIGAFNHLMEPQREANMREAVRRYLPFGLEMNILYADEETNS
jgi:hypothetical protein